MLMRIETQGDGVVRELLNDPAVPIELIGDGECRKVCTGAAGPGPGPPAAKKCLTPIAADASS